MLLERWADVNHNGAAALLKAVEIGRPDLVAALLSAPIRPSPRSLDIAVGKAHEMMYEKDTSVGREIIQMCLSLGATGPNTTRLATEGIVDAVRRHRTLLLDTVLRLRQPPDEYEALALKEAIRAENVEILRKLLDFRQSRLALTAGMMQAMEVNDIKVRYNVVLLLIQAGAQEECTAEAFVKATCSVVATTSKEGKELSRQIFDLLLEEGKADIDYRNGDALQVAVRAARKDLAEEIVNRKPSTRSLGAALPLAMATDDAGQKQAFVDILVRNPICELAAGKALVEAFKAGPSCSKLIEALLRRASVNYNNGEVFIYAIRNFRFDAFSLLLGQGISYKALFTAVNEAVKVSAHTRKVIFKHLIGRLGLDHLNISLKHIVLQTPTDLDLVEMLLDGGADALHQEGVCVKHASYNLNLDLIRVLSRHSGQSETVFTRALSCILSRGRQWIALEHLELIQILLRNGASGQVVDKAMVEMVDHVVGEESRRDLGKVFLNVLFAEKADVNYENGKAVGIAAGRGDSLLLTYLLAHGATPTTASLALSAAMMAHHDEELLLQLVTALGKRRFRRVDVSEILPGKLNPILLCLKSYPTSVALVDSLVAAGCSLQVTIPFQIYADETIIDQDGRRVSHEPEPISILMCPLLQEYRATSPAVFRALIRHGADLAYTTPRTCTTALMLAAMSGRRGITRMLLEAGANAAAKDIYGRSALFFASKAGDADLASLLLKSKSPSNDGSLHEASRRFNTRVMQLLLEAGHDANQRSALHGGRTALGELALHGSPKDISVAEEAVDVLSNAGASPLLKMQGKTAIFLALDNPQNETMVPLLLSKILHTTIHSRENTFQQEIYHFSPTMYISKGILHGPQTEKLFQLLHKSGVEDRFYATLGEDQPADAVGIPDEIRDFERLRRMNSPRASQDSEMQGVSHSRNSSRSKKQIKYEALYEEDWMLADKEMREKYTGRVSHGSQMTALKTRSGNVIGHVDLDELKRWHQRDEFLKNQRASA
ncbi:hypothetical protein OQA88_4273 [Cercophora sp. LCS_1]